MGERRGAYRVLVGKTEVRTPFERPRRKWENNIKMDLHEVGGGHALGRSGSGQGQVAPGSSESDNEPSGCIKRAKFLD